MITATVAISGGDRTCSRPKLIAWRARSSGQRQHDGLPIRRPLRKRIEPPPNIGKRWTFDRQSHPAPDRAPERNVAHREVLARGKPARTEITFENVEHLRGLQSGFLQSARIALFRRRTDEPHEQGPERRPEC